MYECGCARVCVCLLTTETIFCYYSISILMNHLIWWSSCVCMLFSRLREKERLFIFVSLPLNRTAYLPNCTGLLFPLFLMFLVFKKWSVFFINSCWVAEKPTYLKQSLSIINTNFELSRYYDEDNISSSGTKRCVKRYLVSKQVFQPVCSRMEQP